MKRRRLWINLALIAGIVVVIVAIFGIALRPQSVEAPQRTATVAEATVIATVTASGTVESAGDIDLNFGATGIVTSVDVEPGDEVRKGQVLATIDRTNAEQQVAAAELTLAQAQSNAATTGSSVATAQQQLALAREVAKASNESLKAAVTQARANLEAVRSEWSAACTNPDNPACPNPSAAEAVRSAQNQVKTAKLAYDKAVELANNNRIGYDLNVNHLGVQVQLSKNSAARSCADFGDTSSSCSSANESIISAEQQYEAALNSRKASILADSQAVEKASMALSNAEVALKQTLADLEKGNSDAVRKARQALTNAEIAYDSGRAKNAQSVLTAQSTLTTAQASVLPVEDADGGEVTAAEASVASAQAALAVAKRALEQTTITAPVDGTVGSVNLTVGQSSAASAVAGASSSSSAAITLIPAGTFTATADFAESDAAQVQLGDPALVTFQALPGVSIPGKVLRIDPSASTSATDQLVTFRIVVSMDGIPSTVRPGMTASISITTDEAAGVLAVPQAAITTVGGVSTVQVLQPDNTTVETTVQLGLKGDALTEITDGVAKGDVLAIPTGTSGVSEFPRGGPPGAPQSRSRN